MKRALLIGAASVTGLAVVAGIPFIARSMLAETEPLPRPAVPAEKPAEGRPAEARPAEAREPIAPAPLILQPVAPPAPPLPKPIVAAPVLPAADVLVLERRLADLGYMMGLADGILDGASKHGLTAFQKVEGLGRTGQADAATLERLTTAVTPPALYTTPPRHIEVDIARQVIFVVENGKVTNILPTSTGNGRKFTSEGWTRRAVTPNGAFAIYGKRAGWRKSPLGRLYRPAYFNGGIALHGSRSVPASPASHGCVRVPMAFADWFADNVATIGTGVYVYGNSGAPNPPAISDTAALMPAPKPPPDVPLPAEPLPAEPPPPADQPGLLPGIL
ncbi:MAG: L,D-transpeptidase family protein [Actinomycetota bacterium]